MKCKHGRDAKLIKEKCWIYIDMKLTLNYFYINSNRILQKINIIIIR